MNLLRKLKAILLPEIDDTIRSRIIKNNTRNMSSISTVAVLVESLILLLLLLTTPEPWEQEHSSIISLLFCIGASALVRLFISVHDRSSGCSATKHKPIFCPENLSLIIYFVLMIHWAMSVSLRHFRAGEQMMTFFIVELIFIGFTTIHPLFSFFLIFGSFFEFYQILGHFGDISKVDILNYCGLALLCYLTFVSKYRSQVAEIRSQLKTSALNVQLQGLSLTDTLTGIGNRLAVRKRVEDVVGHEICVMLADADYFKEFNDIGGHEVGDEVLILIADTLKECFPVDSCFRYGGDEFLVITTGVSPEDFAIRRDRWLHELETKDIPKIKRRIRCSSGFLSGNPSTEIEIRNMIHEADKKLYEDKKIHHHAEAI